MSLPQSPEIQSEDKTKPSDKNQLAELLDQVKEIPWMSLWNLALVVGGLLLITYFASIGFLPDLDLKAIAGTVAGVAIIGLFVVVLLGMGLILPTLFLSATDDRNKWLQIAEPLLGICLAYLVLLSFTPVEMWQLLLGWGVFGLLLLGIFLYKIYYFPNTVNRINVFLLFGAVGLWGIWALAFPMLDYSFLANHSEQNEWLEYLHMFLFPLLFAVISLVVAKLPKHQRAGGRFGASIAAVVLMGVASNRPVFIPQAAVAALGLSVQHSSVTLVLSETGCSTANLMLEGKSCIHDQATKLGYLSGAKIISRIGAQVVIDWKPANTSGTTATPTLTTASIATDVVRKEIWRRAVFRKEDVISWAYDVPKPY
jgi:hypothetical protein